MHMTLEEFVKHYGYMCDVIANSLLAQRRLPQYIYDDLISDGMVILWKLHSYVQDAPPGTITNEHSYVYMAILNKMREFIRQKARKIYGLNTRFGSVKNSEKSSFISANAAAPPLRLDDPEVFATGDFTTLLTQVSSPTPLEEDVIYDAVNSELLRLRYVEGYDDYEIAKIYGVSRPVITKRIQLEIARLRYKHGLPLGELPSYIRVKRLQREAANTNAC